MSERNPEWAFMGGECPPHSLLNHHSISVSSSLPMATLQFHLQFLPSNSTKPKNPHSFSFSHKLLLSNKLFCANKFNGGFRSRFRPFCIASSSAEIKDSVSVEIVDERPPFDINLAVILAGFAFEAYTTPPVIFFPIYFSLYFWEDGECDKLVFISWLRVVLQLKIIFVSPFWNNIFL